MCLGGALMVRHISSFRAVDPTGEGAKNAADPAGEGESAAIHEETSSPYLARAEGGLELKSHLSNMERLNTMECQPPNEGKPDALRPRPT